MIAGAFLIGWAGAGGLLQIATSVCNMLFPKIKGTVTALVMIASSCVTTPSYSSIQNAAVTGYGYEYRSYSSWSPSWIICKLTLY